MPCLTTVLFLSQAEFFQAHVKQVGIGWKQAPFYKWIHTVTGTLDLELDSNRESLMLTGSV